MTNKFKVKIPGGYLMVKEVGVENSYPGVHVSFSKNGNQDDLGSLIACVEYHSYNKEIQILTYCKDDEEPVNYTRYSDGCDLL